MTISSTALPYKTLWIQKEFWSSEIINIIFLSPTQPIAWLHQGWNHQCLGGPQNLRFYMCFLWKSDVVLTVKESKALGICESLWALIALNNQLIMEARWTAEGPRGNQMANCHSHPLKEHSESSGRVSTQTRLWKPGFCFIWSFPIFLDSKWILFCFGVHPVVFT